MLESHGHAGHAEDSGAKWVAKTLIPIWERVHNSAASALHAGCPMANPCRHLWIKQGKTPA